MVKLFHMIAIETASMCNRACVFCPNHERTRPDEYMEGVVITKILEELRELSFNGRITNYIYNEPMRDDRALAIIERMATTVPRAHVMVSTNGDYFRSPRDIEAVFTAGARQLLINIYNATDGTASPGAGIRRAAARAKKISGWLEELDVDTKGDIYGPAPKGARRARIEHKYGIRPDSKKLGEKFELQNRSGGISWFKAALTEPLKAMCVRPWRDFNINWKGDAILCCNDFYGKIVLGNVMKETLVDLWNSPKMNDYRRHLQDKDRNLPLCATCDYRGGAYRHLVERV